MQAVLKALTRLYIRVLMKPFMGPPIPLGFQRRWMRLITAAAGGPGGLEQEELSAGGLRIVRLSPGSGGARPAAGTDAIVFAHGGGFTLGSPEAYLGYAGALVRASGADVYIPDYRLAPEDPHPAPTDDLFAAYRAVLERGHEPGRTAIAGDSAGAAIAVSTALSLPEMDVPSPAALVLMSPFLDLTLSGASVGANARRDPMLRRSFLEQGARAHAGGLRRSDPRVSPLFADLGTLPPTLVQVGSDEMLLDDSVRFADRAWADGVEVELQRFEGWWHDFQASAASLRGSRDAVEDIAAFLRRRLGSG